MNEKAFHVYEVVENFDSNINTRRYTKGERFIGFDFNNSAWFNYIDGVDVIPLSYLKKIRKVEFKEC